MRVQCCAQWASACMAATHFTDGCPDQWPTVPPDSLLSLCNSDLQVNDVSVFISHGIEDKLFPIQHTSRLILSQLRQLLPRNNIVYVEFKGGHEVPAAVSKEALEWFLEGKPVIGAKYSQKG